MCRISEQTVSDIHNVQPLKERTSLETISSLSCKVFLRSESFLGPTSENIWLDHRP